MEYIKPLNDDAYPERLGAYVNANPSLGIPGSTVPGEALQHTMTEIINAITAAGLTPDDADLTQLTQAINQYIMSKVASTTVKGMVELATPEEVASGLDTLRVSTPAGLVRIRSNQNILHNWDFRKPVNQRGASSYINNVYTVDRWKTVDGGTEGVVTVATGAVTLYRPAPSYVGLRQYIENPAQYSGLTVTLSARIKGTGSFRIYADGVSYGYIAITDEAEYTLKQATFTLPTIASELYVHFSSGNGGTLYIQRVKLELGKVSTLENDPPMDYGQELLTCQRYYYQSVSGGAPFIYRTRNLSGGTYSIPYFIQYHFPVQMRIAPTVEVTYDINDAAPVTAAGYSVTTVSGSISGDLTTLSHLDINKIVASADL